MEQAMINGIDTSRVAVEMSLPHEVQRVPPAPPAESVDATRKQVTALVNPIISVEMSGLVVVQYRDDAGDVRLQMPSESVVRAYRQRSTPETGQQPRDAAPVTGETPAPQPGTTTSESSPTVTVKAPTVAAPSAAPEAPEKRETVKLDA